MIGMPAERIVRHYDGAAFGPNGMDFVELWYYLQVARTRASGLTNYVIPGVLICILVLNVFLLPPDSGEKISLAITTFLTLMVANQLVADNTPTAKERPIIVSFFTHSMVMNLMSIIFSTWCLRFHHHELEIQPPMGGWTRVIFLQVLPSIVRMSQMGRKS